MRGGKRPGAGRPIGSTMPAELKRRVFNVRLPAWLCKWLAEHAWLCKWLAEQPESSGRLIERSLIMTYDIKEPKMKGGK
jgi:hypothetical protein